jgi:predicted peroxiredoxin
MAKNWKVGEAVRAIQSGNKADIMDIGRRFPLFSNLAAQLNEAGIQMLECVPDYCTARKIESVLKGDVTVTEEETEAEEVKEEPAKEEPKPKRAAKAKAKKVEKKDEDGLEGKTAKELYDMCKEAGLKVKPKQDKAVYIDALNSAKAKAEEVEEDDDWGDEEEEEPKKPVKKAPKKAAKPKKVEEEDDDDWDI